MLAKNAAKSRQSCAYSMKLEFFGRKKATTLRFLGVVAMQAGYGCGFATTYAVV